MTKRNKGGSLMTKRKELKQAQQVLIDQMIKAEPQDADLAREKIEKWTAVLTENYLAVREEEEYLMTNHYEGGNVMTKKILFALSCIILMLGVLIAMQLNFTLGILMAVAGALYLIMEVNND